jgi:outer membrane immunogenic protein
MHKTLLAAIACAMALSSRCLFAADMPVKAPALLPSWTGVYAGLGVGIRASEVRSRTISVTEDGVPDTCPFGAPANTCFFSQSLNDTAFRFGFYGGFNWQIDPTVLVGIEGDGGWGRKVTTLFGSALPGGPFIASGFNTDSVTVNPLWDASIRLRAGYLVTPTFLVYATGGAAWLNFTSTLTCGLDPIGTCDGFFVTPFSITSHATLLGWTAGGGIETKVSPHVLVRGEYRYADFGTHTFSVTNQGATFNIITYEVHPRTHTALFGLAYLF